MIKILSKSKVYSEPDFWIYWTKIIVLPDDKSKEMSVFAGITGEDLFEYLNWSQDKDGDTPKEYHLKKWQNSVAERILNKDQKIFEIYYPHKGNREVLKFLKSKSKK